MSIINQMEPIQFADITFEKIAFAVDKVPGKFISGKMHSRNLRIPGQYSSHQKIFFQ